MSPELYFTENTKHARFVTKQVYQSQFFPLNECFTAACSRAGDVNMAFKLYGELTKAGLQADCQVHNVLLSTCAEAMKSGNLERREQLVLLERAFHLFEDMEATNLQPDTSNWNALICCAARSGQLMRAFEVRRGRCSHSCSKT